MLGPYIKSRGTRGTETSANADHITMETNVQQGETIWKPVFHMSQNVKKNYILGYLGGPEASKIRLGLSCFPAILSPISMYMSNKETIWYEIFKLKPQIWKKYTFFFHIWGVLGGPYVEPRWTKISGQ